MLRKFLIFFVLILSIALLSFGTDLGSSFGALFQNVSPRKGSAPPSYTLETGLVGHWTFDGKDMPQGQVNDISGQGNNGSMYNMSTSTSYVPGKLGQGLNFDGVNDHVRAVHILGAINTVTMSAWVKNNNATIAGSQSIVFRGTALTFELFVSGNDDLQSWIENSVAWHGAANSAAFTDWDQWHHVVAVYDGSNVRLYRDGSQVAISGSETGNLPSSTRTIITQGSSSAYWQGLIDDVRIYNRALSASEVKQLYLQGSSLKQSITPRKGSNPSTFSIDSGLVGHWTFDGKDTAWNSNTTQDKSGQGNSGTMTSMSTSTAPVPGKLGQGFLFDGVNDYASVTDPGSGILDFGDTADMTISAWVNRNTFDTYDVIVAKQNDTGSIGYSFYIQNDSFPAFVVHDGTDQYFINSNDPIRSIINTSGWHHLVAVWDQDSAANTKIYIDGIAPGGISAGTIADIGDLSTALNLRIGDFGNDTLPFDGSLDDVRIYNRTLSASEVKQLYLQGSSLKQNITPRKGTNTGTYSLDSGLVGHWTFDGKDTAWNSNTTQDKSGQGNSGTMTSMSTSTSPVPGKLGQGFNFDGVDDYVDAGDPGSGILDFGAGQDFTLSAWVKSTQAQVFGRYPSIIRKALYGTRYSYDLILNFSTDEARWGFETWSNNISYFVLGATSITDGTWHHVIAMRQGTDLITYQDGVFANSAVAASPTLENTSPFGIGSDPPGGVNFVNGRIDDVRVYNRALSADEVKQLYLMGR